MTPVSKLHGILSASHGTEDIGFAQTAGTITSIAALGGQTQYRKYAVVLANAAHNLTKGQTVNITGTTDYDGPTRVLAIVSTTKFLIKRAFTVTKAGAWDSKVAEGNWDAFMPIGANISAANLALVFWRPNEQGGADTTTDYTADKLYIFPGGLKRVTISTAGNLRLFRAASEKPGDGKNLASPTVVGYTPSSGAVGASVDIIGTNFDPNGENNVKFNGVVAYPTDQTEEYITVPVPVGATTGTVTVVTRGVTATGPSFTVS